MVDLVVVDSQSNSKSDQNRKVRMNDSMKNEQQDRPRGRLHVALTLGFSVFWLPVGFTGCRGTPLTFPQSLSGLNAPTRVPAPATGSFQVPGSYSGPSSSSSGGLGGSSFSPASNSPSPNNLKTSQSSLPVSNFMNGISAAQSQLRTATNNAMNSVNRATEDVNTRVEQATARVDRMGEGVVQASAILSDAANAPLTEQPMSYGLPTNGFPTSSTTALPASGKIGDSVPSENATWRTPSQP
jgi:hypothetical protein